MAGHLFSNKELKKLILPLFMEQLLVMLVGIADTFVVSYAGGGGGIRRFSGKFF